jgi:hypothetical protein
MSRQVSGTVLRFKEWLAMKSRRQALIRRIKRTVRFYLTDDDNLVVTASRSDD